MGKKKEPQKKKKRLGTMDIILMVVGALLIIFTIEMIREFRLYGSIPDTLCTCVFAALGGECGVMGWIKTTKDRHRERGYELDDRKYYDEKEKTANTGGETEDNNE